MDTSVYYYYLEFICQKFITIDLTTLRNGADKYVLESQCDPAATELSCSGMLMK